MKRATLLTGFACNLGQKLRSSLILFVLATISFSIQAENNSVILGDELTCSMTDGGSIAGPSSACSGEEFTLTNAALPSTNGYPEYAWIISYDGATWDESEIVYSDSPEFTTSITQTTWFRRCAIPAGCGWQWNQSQESNWVQVDVDACSCGTITGIYFYDCETSTQAYGPITDGETINVNDLPSSYFLATEVEGNIESISYTVNGSSITENVSLYTFPGGAGSGVCWNPSLGNNFVNVGAYQYDNADGLCDSESLMFELIETCSNVTYAGVIGYDQSVCSGTAVATIENIELPSGGSGELEYVWLSNNSGPSVTGAVTIYHNDASYAPGLITETTWFRRCARRVGCDSYDGESNWVQITITDCGSDCEYIEIDQWENNTSCQICNDGFTSTILDAYNGAQGDMASFEDPICDPNSCINSVTITFNVAAADYELDTNEDDVDQLDISYPIEINGQVIGYFDPEELPYTCNVCESNDTKTVTFDIDPDTFNYNYGGTNTLDLNFYEFGADNDMLQDVCVGNVLVEFGVEVCEVPCDPHLTVVNDGYCVIDLYHWVSTGDEFEAEIQPGESYTVSTYDGAMWRAVGDGWNLEFDEEYTVNGCGNQTWTLFPTYCGPVDVTDWNYSCDEGVSVEIVGRGLENNIPIDLCFENTGSIFQTVVEIVYKGGNPGNSVIVEDNEGNEYTAFREQPTGSSSNVWVYRAVLPGTACVNYSEMYYDHKAQSIVAYLFRNDAAGVQSSGTFTHTSGYNNIQAFSIDIPTDVAARDIIIELPISEITLDGRYLHIQATAGPVSNGYTNVYTAGSLEECCLDIFEVLLEDVPGDVDQVVIEVDTRHNVWASANGQSWVMAGAIKTNVECAVDCELMVDVTALNDDAEVCEGDEVVLTANVTGDSNCAECCSRTVTNTINCNSGIVYGLYFVNSGANHFELLESTWTECGDGTAQFTGTGTNGEDIIHATLFFSGGSAIAPADSPKHNNCGTTDTEGWMYYTETSGTIISENHGTFHVTRMGEAFQTGNGANVTGPDNEYGGSGWLVNEGGDDFDGFYGNGDINIMLSEECTFDGSESGIEYLWSNGQTTQSITVTEPGLYCVYVTDCNGCSDAYEFLVTECSTDCEFQDDNFEYCGESITGDVSENDPSAADSYTLIEAPAEGILTFNEDGSFVYENSMPGTYTFSVESCVGIVNPSDELCTHGVFELSVEFLGPNGSDVTVTNNNNNDTFGTFTNVQNGDILVIQNNTGTLNGQSNNWDFYVDGDLNTDIHTSCSEPLLGETFGDFYVLGYIDGQGAINIIEQCCESLVTIVNVPKVLIGDYVWSDTNNNGCQDDDELGLEGIVITLFECTEEGGVQTPNGTEVASTTSDENGYYEFEVCYEPNAFYYLNISNIPEGYQLTTQDACGNDATDSDANPEGNTDCFELPEDGKDDCDFGISGPGSLGDYVWYDDNQNGIQDADELGTEGVTVELYVCGEADPIATTTTDANGFYIFENLVPGDYYVVFSNLPGEFEFTNANQGGDDTNDSDAGADGSTDCVEVLPGEFNDTVDAGIFDQVNIGDYVWFDTDRDGIQDADEEGVEGVTVTLFDEDGNVVATDVTDENGLYLFENVLPGDYTIGFSDLPADYVFSPANQGGDDENDSDANEGGQTDPFTVLASQDDDLSFDAGINQPVSSLGDYVWLDSDQDGIQDPEEEGAEGVTVELYICGEVDPIASTTTDENGFYIFENLEPGDYYVVFSNLPGEFEFTNANQGGDDTIDSDAGADGSTDCVEVLPGEFNDTVDAGIFDQVNIGDYVWFDTNRDGIQNADEEGVEGVTVTLFDADGNVVATDVTDENGLYLFENVLPGDYTIGFSDLPADYVFSPANQGGDDENDSDANEGGQTDPFTVLASQDDDLSFDAGINQPVSSLGDYVWEDEDKDGIQDPEENGIEGVSVELYICGEVDPIASTTTDENGFYIFENLEPNVEYYVVFGQPDGYIFSNQDQGGDDANDSDANEDGSTDCIEVGPDEFVDTVDAGLYIPTNIGDYVWFDEDQDGIQDADEEGVEGVTVTLFDEDGNVVATDVTDENGLYLFEDVDPGNYYIEFDEDTLPADLVFTNVDQGGDDELDSDANILTGTTDVFTVTYGQDDDLSFDAGVTLCSEPFLVEDEPMDMDVSCEMPIPAVPELTFSDQLDDELIVVFNEEFVAMDCGAMITRTWEATNYCGNSVMVDQVINIFDNTPPVIVEEPEDMTIECDEAIPEIIVVFEDNCDNELTVVVTTSFEEVGCNQVFTKTCTATDACGNSVTSEVNVYINDTTAPELMGVPEDQDLECGDDVPVSLVSATDNCDDDLEIAMTMTTEINDCGEIMVRTWTVADDCGNETSMSQTINIIDTTAPEVVSAPEDVTIECDEDEPTDEPVFSDICDDELDITAISGITNVTDCGYSIERAWTATDDCGNATTVSQVITVVDTTAPVFGDVPADVTVDCEQVPAPAVVTATDNCSDVTIDLVEVVEGICPYTITRTWTATDVCGNAADYTQVVTVVDTTAPVMVGLPEDATVECDNVPAPAVVTVSDNCDDEPSLTFEEEIEDAICGYTIYRTWSTMDNCQNTDTYTQTITVVDNTPPVIVEEPEDMTIECDEEIPEIIVVFEDNCDDELTVVVTTSFEEVGCNQVFTKTCTATDACGNSVTSEVNVYINDTTAPELMGVPEDQDLECGDDVPVALVTAMDNCDDDLEIAMTMTTEINDCGEIMVRTWTVADDCGNETSMSQTINVIDTTAPEVVSAPEDVTIECDEDEPTDEPVFSDICDDELDITAISGITNVTDCGYSIERAWTATDDCGNATTVSQVITVVDTTAPVFGDVPADVTVDCEQVPAPAVVTATDNCSDVTIDLVEVVEGICPYTITRTWTATDVCGNAADYTQVVTVVDTTAPVMVGLPEDATVECDNVPAPAVVTVSDNCDDEPSLTFEEEIEDAICGYTIYRTWSTIDNCQNTDTYTQTITVVDTTDPMLIGVPEDLIAQCTDVPEVPVVTATDNCDDDLTVVFNEVIEDLDCGYIITRTWFVEDDCENSDSATQVITVEDTIDPVLVGVPQDSTVECGDDTTPPLVTATDNCATTVPVSLEETTNMLACGFEIVRTWTATDACGNEVMETATLTVVDTTPPMLIGLPEDVTIECGDDIPDAMVTAVDICDDELVVSMEMSTVNNDCGVTVTRSFFVMDDCGNEATATQHITIVDTTPPTLVSGPEDMTVDCDAPDMVEAPVWDDNCDDDLEIAHVVTEEGDACLLEITHVWTATDDCGNESSYTVVITVVDDEAPMLTIPADAIVDCAIDNTLPGTTGEATAVDNCVEVTLDYVDGPILGDCPITFERTWIATDLCGNMTEDVQLITIIDETAPEIVCPQDVTIECTDSQDPLSTGVATANDDCNEVVIAYTDGPITGDCPYTYERTWTATDLCGNASECVQLITVQDTQAPVLSGTDDVIDGIECNVALDIIAPTATDNCDLDVEIDASFELIPGDCPNERTEVFTWTAIDDCGNTAVRTLTVNYVDTTAPELSDMPEDAIVECDAIPDAEVITATDNCDDDVEVIYVEETAGVVECVYNILRTWTATDDCGNETSYTQTLTVVDTTAPVVVSAPEDVTIECDEDEPTDMPVFEDSCDDELELTAISGINNVTDCGYLIEKTWTAIDDCGNAVSVSQTITVQDTTVPVLSEIPADVTVDCSSIPTPADVTATDNCSEPTVTFEEVIGEGCPYTITRTWTATDVCGNTTSDEQVITVEDNEAPILIGVPEDVTEDCGDAPEVAVVTAEDNCYDVEVEFSEEIIGNSCPLTVIRTWTATDPCGNTVSASQSIVIDDEEAPVFVSGPEDETVECDAIPTPGIVEVEDNCDLNPEVTFSEEEILADCGWTIIRTWTAEDLCENTSTYTQTITVVDETAPVLTGVPANVTVECTQIPNAPVVTANDNCYEEVIEVMFNEAIVEMVCGYEIVRTWTASDNCDNAVVGTQVITVTDTTDPFVVSTPEDLTIECDEEISFTAPEFGDDCDDELTITFDEMMNPLECGFTLIRTWTATDDCGNDMSTAQTITVVDTTNPVLGNLPAAELTVECDDIPVPAIVTASDNCSDDLEVILTEEATGSNCPLIISRTWTATDDCGNTASFTQLVSVVDTTAPMLIGVPEDATAECDDIPAPAVVTAEDNCDDDLTVDFVEATIPNDCGYTLVRTWSAEDFCGNVVSATQEIVVVDTTAPTVSEVPADATYECDEEIPFAEPVFDDNCDNEVLVEFTTASSTDGCTVEITRTWTGYDDCENETSVTQTITVVDTTDPILVGVPADETIECDEEPTAYVVTAIDNCDSDMNIIAEANVTINDCGSEIIRTWFVEDDCGNSAFATQTVTIVDTTPPVLFGVPEDQDLECGDDTPDAFVSAMDNCDDDLEITLTIETITSDCGSSIVRVWTVSDNCGNETSASQTLTVIDTTPPTLTNVPENTTIECDEEIPAASVEATDICDDMIEVEESIEILDGSCPTIAVRTWTAVDACGNEAMASQTITIVDTTDPVLNGVPADATVECDDIPEPVMVTATDNCDDDLTVVYNELIEDLDCGAIITRTWTVEDVCGNVAEASQVLTVVDTTNPELMNVPANITVECDEVPVPANVTAMDSCDDDVLVEFSEEIVEADCGYTIIRTWTAYDNCQNTDEASQEITVVDTTAPVITAFPIDITVECDDVPGFGLIQFDDNCDENPLVTTGEISEDQECGYILTRTWTVTDNCGNASSVSQIITVIDSTVPELEGVPEDSEVECGDDIPAPAAVTATDNCDASPVVTVEEVTEALDCGLQVIRTYTATDNCGNSYSEVEVITIVDTTPPVIGTIPADETVNCDEIDIPATVTATDLCDDEVEVTLTEEISGGCPYTLTRTWTAVDACGNESSASQVITVIDEEAPVWDPFVVEVEVSCDEVDAYTITATDNCDDDLEIIIEEVNVSGSCYGTIIRTYTAIDNCGNEIEATQIINIIDEIAPAVLNVPADVTIECGEEIPAISEEVTAEDNCATLLGGGLTIEFTEVQTNEFCPYQIIRTWTAIDECGNVAEGVQVIDVTVETPEQVSLMSYPNPFDEKFTVEFSVPEGSTVVAAIYDMQGRLVENIFDGEADAHRLYDYDMTAVNWEAGTYIIYLEVDGEIFHHRMVLTK